MPFGPPSASMIRLILFLGGAAALGWQVIWAHHLGVALGASARGVALTVATAMAGMTVGAILCARLLRRGGNPELSPILLYGALELLIGLCALLPGAAEGWIMSLDVAIHRRWPLAATPFSVLALVLTIGPATLAMGATVPVMGLLARQAGTPLSRLYAFNTAGAATGTLLVAFLLLPTWGLGGGSTVLALTHLGIALACGVLARKNRPRVERGSTEGEGREAKVPTATAHPGGLVFLSGAAAFLLEVAWFRSLRSAWFSTADSLAVMLFCFLLALAWGAALAPKWRRSGLPLWGAFAGAAVLVLLATPALARFDLVESFQHKGAYRQLARILAGLVVMGPPVALLGLVLPTLLDEGRRPRDWARLYAINTFGAVVGANLAAWLLLEWIGPSRTAWVAAALLALGAWLSAKSHRTRLVATATCLLALAFGAALERGDQSRIPGAKRSLAGDLRLVERRHGPDASISVVGFNGGRALLINGFVTTAEAEDPRLHYMEAMGRLPMLLHPDPKEALVICFGTGQTAHAVRDEGPERLDLVDLSAAVFELAPYFETNHEVLADPRVRTVVMDGRAWLRRTETRYDVVSLEPMPPFFSGSNSLYSTGFYQLVSSRLRPGGLLAQWFPLHLMTPDQAASVAAAFVEVFPDSILWIDPGSLNREGWPDQGVLIGRQSDGKVVRFWEDWPGQLRLPESGRRTLPAFETRRQVALDPEGLRRFVAGARPVTDDNLLLEYGLSPYRDAGSSVVESIRRIHERIDAAKVAPAPGG